MSGVSLNRPQLALPTQLNSVANSAASSGASGVQSLSNTASPVNLSQMQSLSLGMGAGGASGEGIKNMLQSMMKMFMMMMQMMMQQGGGKQGYPAADQGAQYPQQPQQPAYPQQPQADAGYDAGYKPPSKPSYPQADVSYPLPAKDAGGCDKQPAPPAKDIQPPVYNQPPAYPPPAKDVQPPVYKPPVYPPPAKDTEPPMCDKPVYPAPTPPPAADTGYDNGYDKYKPPVYTPPAKDTEQPPMCDKPTYPKPPNYDTAPPSYDNDEGGGYEGDPHFSGFGGESYDIQGKNNTIYNILSDQKVQYNARFENWGDKGATAVGEIGLQVGNSKIHYDKDDAAPTLNGKALAKGQSVKLDAGGTATWDGNKLDVKTSEYTFDISKTKSSDGTYYLNSNVKVTKGGNPLGDLVSAHGLLGQTADGDGLKKGTGVGDKGANAQGGGMIDTFDKDGKVVISKAGDKTAVNNYEVSDIFGQTNNAFNRFGVQVDQNRTNEARQDLNGDGKLDITRVYDTNGNVVMVNPALLKKEHKGSPAATEAKGNVA